MECEAILPRLGVSLYRKRTLPLPFLYRKTDDLGFYTLKDPVHVNDFHATLLHQMGINHGPFTFRFQGRDYRLTDVAGNVIKPLLG